jgi:uncharacterized membrane protein (UPF0127 family)
MFKAPVVISSMSDAEHEIVIGCYVTEDDEERRTGLLKFRDIDWLEGMLFVFDSDRDLVFHTEGMKFPIDIIFIKPNGVVCYIEKEVVPGIKNISYRAANVLEVKGGFCDKFYIDIGSLVFFDDIGLREIIPAEVNYYKKRIKVADSLGVGQTIGDIFENQLQMDPFFKAEETKDKRRKRLIEQSWIGHYTFDPETKQEEPGTQNP